jgi:RNA polymerase sigma-70 factor (ECF subfamily)
LQPSDDLLVQLSKAGDRDAFNELIKRYESKIYSIAYRFSGNHSDAGDLAQEAFIKAFRGLNSFRGDASFATWIYKILSNVCRDEIRKQQRHKLVSLDDLTIHSGNSSYLISTELSPQDYLEKIEIQNLVQEQLNSLPSDQRLILVMRELQGMTYEEIAKEMDCNLGTVKSRLSRARQSLKNNIISCQEHFAVEPRLRDKGEEG